MNNFLETRISRRGFLESGAIAAGAKASGAAAIAVEAAEAWQRIEPYAQLLIPQEFRIYPWLSRETHYSPEALNQTHIVTFGDSIARGKLEQGGDYPAAFHIENAINRTFQGAQWHWDNEAIDGATVDETVQQIKASKRLSKNQSTDVILSAGGNNLLYYLREQKEQIESILANPFNQKEVKDFVRGLEPVVTGVGTDFKQILNALKEKKAAGANLQRIFVVGIPNIEYADKVTLSENEEISIDGIIKRRLAHNLPRLGNQAMLQAINDEGFNAGFDIVFLNTYDELSRNQLTGMHPNKEGYVTLANRQLQRSYAVLSGQRISLFDATQKAA